MPSEVQWIQDALERNMEDLHILYSAHTTSMDALYYIEVNDALLKAEIEIKRAIKNYKYRMNI